MESLPEDERYFLACDIGGTNARFRVVQRSLKDSMSRKELFFKVSQEVFHRIGLDFNSERFARCLI
jgi:glucokinase